MGVSEAGAGVEAAEGISSMVMPGMEGNPGISIPRIGGRDIPPLPPPSIEDMLLLIIEEEEEKEETDEEDIFDDEDPICIEPMFDIILLIMSSMLEPPPIKLMPPIPPMPPIEPMEGIAPPPEDIMVEEEEDEEVDLKLEMVLPSSDCVVAAMLWLLAFSSFFTAVPSSVTKACDCAFMASLTSAPSGAWICLGADTVRMPAPEYVDASCSVTTPAGILNSLVNFLELLDPSSFFDSCTASTMMMSSLVFKAKSSGAKPGSSIWILSLLADTWMLWAASPSPAPATPIARALNSA